MCSKRLLIYIILLGLICACSVGPDYAPPKIAVPEKYDARPPAVGTAGLDAWWKGFNDPVLEDCIKEARTANRDLLAAQQRIQVARAMRRMTSSRFWPDIDSKLSHTVDRLSENNPRLQDAIQQGFFPRDVEYWDIGFDVNWEVDVFGGVRRRVEGAVARIEEEAFRRLALMLTIEAEVARNFFEIIGHQHKLKTINAMIAVAQKQVGIMRKKHHAGLIPASEILQHQSHLQALNARKPAVEADLHAGRYRLAVLMGRSPEETIAGLNEPRPMPPAVERVPVGLPSDLLRRRPDILAVERKLAAATADIGVAAADFFPRFFLTGSPGWQSGNFTDLFASASNAWVFGPAVTWKLFSSGRNRAQLEAAKAVAEQVFIEYETTVVEALEEVESALTRYGKEALSLRFTAAALATRKREVGVQHMRLQNGLVDYLAVAVIQAGWLDTKWTYIQQQVNVLTRLAALYKALGGGWTPNQEGGANLSDG
jgi:NodT family efflux transporter outer membrane factor (OMF) lipoprotein